MRNKRKTKGNKRKNKGKKKHAWTHGNHDKEGKEMKQMKHAQKEKEGTTKKAELTWNVSNAEEYSYEQQSENMQ